MISIEGKFLQEIFLKGEGRKLETEKTRRNVNIEKILNIFSEKVRKQENGRFIKKTTPKRKMMDNNDCLQLKNHIKTTRKWFAFYFNRQTEYAY